MSGKTVLALLGIIVLAIFLRFWDFKSIPPGLYPDEAMNGNNATEAIAYRHFKVFYPDNNGREGLFINLQAVSISIFGFAEFREFLGFSRSSASFFSRGKCSVPTRIAIVSLSSPLFFSRQVFGI